MHQQNLHAHVMQRGLVFNIQRCSVQDGPGIRTTVFLKGCPLRCAWCHNPEGMTAAREIYVVESLCLGCGECRRACARQPNLADIPGNLVVLPSRVEGCQYCGACLDACPTQARRIAGQEMTVAEVLAEVLRDRLFFESSGGGVTFSGGEPLRQSGFLLELLKACRSHGLHTAVDTCGMAPTEDLLGVAQWTDLFLYDLKLMDRSAHHRYTGVSNELVLANLRQLGRVHPRIWVRVPFVRGVNDSEEEVHAAATFAASVPGVRQVNLLPFHRLGSQKLGRLGMSAQPDFEPPTKETIARALRAFEKAGLAAHEGG